jgi:hypothetical protein
MHPNSNMHPNPDIAGRTHSAAARDLDRNLFESKGSIMKCAGRAIAASLLCSAACGQQSSMQFQLTDNLIRVPVTLNGHETEAVLDSGTGALALDRDFAVSLGLEPGAAMGMAPGGGKPMPMFPVTIAQVQFGPEHLTQVAGTALDLSHLSSSAGFLVHVLLGMPLFEKQALQIDYPGRRLVFLPAEQEAECSDPIPISFVSGAPLVAVTLQATRKSAPVTLHLIVDLGTRHHAVMLGGPFLNTAEGEALQSGSKPMRVGTGIGGAIDGSTARLESLTIGGHHFAGLTAALTHDVGAFAAGTADGTLGVPLWEDGIVTFDYAHRVLCLDLPKRT